MLSICFLLGEVNDFTVAGVAVKLQSVTLELGSIFVLDVLFPFLSMLASNSDNSTKKPLQDNIGREKDRYQSSETQVECP